MSLSDIFCQERAVSILQAGFNCGRSAHAFIFAGIDGVGKFTTARQYAKLLLCENTIENDSCGRCKSCTAIEADSHPDFIHIYKELLEFTKDGKNKTTPLDMPINVIREFLIEAAPKKPMLSNHKVFVVSEAEKLNNSSQNALLKVLEEPPAYCTIILLCSRLEKLLATTKSRCQIVQFGPIDENIIINRLGELGLDSKRALFFARLAGGSIGLAVTYSKLELESQEVFKMKCQIINTLANLKYEQCLDAAQSFITMSGQLQKIWSDFDKQVSSKDLKRRASGFIINVVISAFRDVMKAGLGRDDSLVNSDQRGLIDKISRKFSEESAAEKITDCFESIRWLEAAVNEKLLFEQLLLNLAGSAIIQD